MCTKARRSVIIILNSASSFSPTQDDNQPAAPLAHYLMAFLSVVFLLLVVKHPKTSLRWSSVSLQDPVITISRVDFSQLALLQAAIDGL